MMRSKEEKGVWRRKQDSSLRSQDKRQKDKNEKRDAFVRKRKSVNRTWWCRFTTREREREMTVYSRKEGAFSKRSRLTMIEARELLGSPGTCERETWTFPTLRMEMPVSFAICLAISSWISEALCSRMKFFAVLGKWRKREPLNDKFYESVPGWPVQEREKRKKRGNTM